MSDRILGVAFDLEGTCVDREPAHHNAHLYTARDIGVTITDLGDAFVKIPHFIGGPHEAIVDELFALCGGAYSKEFISNRDRAYYHQLDAEMPIVMRPGLEDFLKRLHRDGVPMAVGSLTERKYAKRFIDESGMGAFIDRSCVVLKEDVERVKPAPDVFIETAKRMGIDPKNQLVFEDSPRGVAAAIAAGSRAVGMPVYNRPDVVMQLLTAGACRVFMDWREINIYGLLNNLSE